MNSRWADYVRDIARQSQPALARLYDESSALVYGLALRMLRQPAAAEEITFDVYRCVWSLALDYQPSQGSVHAWLVDLTRTRALDRMRKSRSGESAEAEVTPANEISNDRSDAVLKALERLTPVQRELMELAFFSGLGEREIAHRLAIPCESVKTEVRLAVVTLRELLTPLREA